MSHDEKWSEMDEVAVRKNLRDLMCFGIPEEGSRRHLETLKKVRSMFMEELASAVYLYLNHTLETSPKNTANDAWTLVNRISTELGQLGLAIKHPTTDKPMRLTVAATPPEHGQSWLQLEPAVAQGGRRDRAERLTSPLPNLRPCPSSASPAEPRRGGPDR